MHLPSVSAYLWLALLSHLSSVAENDALLGWDHVTDLAISNIPFLCFENVLGCFCSMLWLICTEKHYWSVMELLIFVLLFLEIMRSSCTSFVIFGLSDLFYGAEPASAFVLFKNIQIVELATPKVFALWWFIYFFSQMMASLACTLHLFGPHI